MAVASGAERRIIRWHRFIWARRLASVLWTSEAAVRCTKLLGSHLAPDHAPGSTTPSSTPRFEILISGIMHYIYLPEYVALRHLGGGTLLFFPMQAVAISFEEFVQRAGRRLGFKASWKAVGYFWVWSWFAFCLPVWLLNKGVFEELRYSLIVLLRRRSNHLEASPLPSHWPLFH
ncbi:hypothetical protein C8R45DRAFT_920644 [Mycena sanguinolenta]|nr:hypothetical protein C8R45DRAFT_920644 [Mycena sanguinolenta]